MDAKKPPCGAAFFRGECSVVRDVPGHDAHDDGEGDEDGNHHGAGFLRVQWLVMYQVTQAAMMVKATRIGIIMMSVSGVPMKAAAV